MKIILTLIVLLGLTAPAFSEDSATKSKPSSKSQVLAKSLTPEQRIKLLDLLNLGDDQALSSLPGIGVNRLVAIKKARPILNPVDLLKVTGIGDGTFGEIIAYVKAGFPILKKQ